MIYRNELFHNGPNPPHAVNGSTVADFNLLPGHRGLAAIRYLAEAAGLARDLGRDPWDFAVEIQTFRELGLTNNDLRWLICKGLLEHKQEVTAVGDSRRGFQPDRPLCFSENTCIVLSEEGLAFARSELVSLATRDEAAGLSSTASRNGRSSELVPKWDRERQELRVGKIVVKQFKVPAINQERILAAFEEEGWPVQIDDPLPPHPEQDPKRRLHDTINSLNRNQKEALIQFSGNGNGQGVRWVLGRNGERRGEHSAPR